MLREHSWLPRLDVPWLKAVPATVAETSAGGRTDSQGRFGG